MKNRCLEIRCNTNIDLAGKWWEANVENDMRELDMEITSSNAWIEYILGHVFEEIKLPSGVYDVLVSGSVRAITFETSDGDVISVTLTA